MSDMQLSLLNDTFNLYYAAAQKAYREKNGAAAKRNYLLAAETMLKMAKLSSPQLKRRASSAQSGLRSLPTASTPPARALKAPPPREKGRKRKMAARSGRLPPCPTCIFRTSRGWRTSSARSRRA